MGEESVAAAFSPLSRHRLRRAQGIPTISVLVGAPDVSEWVWESWLRSSGRNAASVRAGAGAELLTGWLSDACVRQRFAARIKEHVAAQVGLAADDYGAWLAGMSTWQFDDMVASLVPLFGCSETLLISGLKSPDAWAVQGDEARLVTDFASVATQLGESSPGLLCVCAEGAAALSSELVRALAVIAEAAPHVDFGVVAGPRLEFLNVGCTGRDAAFLREGVLRLEDNSSASPARHVPEGVLLSYDHAEFARSRAERSLYRRLESRSTTRGLFVLNARLEEHFGSGKLEVDLLSERLRLALEVDGYHHFRDSSAYRRDRRKDLLLQELGYLVVRVLASDVADEPDHILELIDRAVARRSATSA